jgi:hypothetical protein
MSEATALLDRARKKRDAARRARELVWQLEQDADKERLTHFADDLDEQAGELERQAAALVPPTTLPSGGVVHEQQQVQQQQAAECQPADPSEQKPKPTR